MDESAIRTHVDRVAGVFDVTGLGVLVTGGASGLGKAMAAVMAEAGANVTVVDADTAALEQFGRGMEERGSSIRTVVADVSDWSAIDDACQSVVDTNGHLDVVFANAGMSGGGGPLAPGGAIEELPADRWQRVLDVNLSGIAGTVRAAARHIRTGGSGRVIVTSSVAGLRYEPVAGYPYAASKAAILALVRQAAPDLARKGISINAIAPSGFQTNIGGGRTRLPEVAEYFSRGSVFGRMADPREVEGLALLLASPAASYITGSVFTIDGGADAHRVLSS